MLSLQKFSQIVFSAQPVHIDDAAMENVAANHAFLRGFSDHKLIYGINTGFGPMAQFKISAANLLDLQYNLIRSHSSGGGRVFNALLGKAVMVARLNSLVQGEFLHPGKEDESYIREAMELPAAPAEGS